MDFLHLPEELRLMVGKYLEKKDINSLSQTSRSLYPCFNLLLYKRDFQSGNTALLWAANNGKLGTARLAIQAGVDVNVTSRTGRTPLSYAANFGHDAVVKVLLETGRVDVDSKDCESRTPLSYAAEFGHEAVVKVLLETGRVDVDSNDCESRTPLSYAAECGHEAVLKVLLETGRVDVDSNDSDGRTPLFYAAFYRHEAVEKVLLGKRRVGGLMRDSYRQQIYMSRYLF